MIEKVDVTTIRKQNLKRKCCRPTQLSTETRVLLISAWSQQLISPVELTFDGITLFPSNREINRR